MPDLKDVLKGVANRYPKAMIEEQLRDIPRIAFNIEIGVQAVRGRSHKDLAICDLGGGIGLFSAGCAAYGMKHVVLIDDFDDSVNHQVGDSILDLHRSLGVEVISRDVVEKGIADIPQSFDIITTFDSMEHWHNSPKRLFHDVFQKLNPGGAFVLGVPNCVNLRKRISVPFGIGKWSTMQSWYEAATFRAHVREPDVNDLQYIARDMGLTDVKIYGRNWQGDYSPQRAIRFATKIVDYPLRRLPKLCADIYVVGRKA